MTVNPTSFARLDNDDFFPLDEPDEFVDQQSNSSGIFGWAPFIPSPPPLSVNRLAGQPVSRAPVRQLAAPGETPLKQDPRLSRHTEQTQMVINGLVRTGGIYRSGTSDWSVSYVIRQMSGTSAFNGEVFYNTTTGLVSWKDENGVIFAFSGGGSGSGTIDGGSP